MKTRQDIADWSTINLDLLKRLKVAELGNNHLQADCGNGCAGDPPGYPTYFTRSVYTQDGNSPHMGPQMVILYDGNPYVIETEKTQYERRKEILHSLWLPLPLDHIRTQSWIREKFIHHNHCYRVPGTENESWHSDKAMLIWPGGCLGTTPFGKIRNKKFEIEWKQRHESWDKLMPEEQEKFIAELEANNERITRMCEEIATPENHDATVLIRKFYPEFQPTEELIAAKYERPGNWWEVMTSPPTPEKCPGQYGSAHPVNGSWCQMCGWKSKTKE